MSKGGIKVRKKLHEWKGVSVGYSKKRQADGILGLGGASRYGGASKPLFVFEFYKEGIGNVVRSVNRINIDILPRPT